MNPVLLTLLSTTAFANLDDDCAPLAGVISVDDTSYPSYALAEEALMSTIVLDGYVPEVVFDDPEAYLGCLAETEETWADAEVSMLTWLSISEHPVVDVQMNGDVIVLMHSPEDSCDTAMVIFQELDNEDRGWDGEMVMVFNVTDHVHDYTNNLEPAPGSGEGEEEPMTVGDKLKEWLLGIVYGDGVGRYCKAVWCQSASHCQATVSWGSSIGWERPPYMDPHQETDYSEWRTVGDCYCDEQDDGGCKDR